MTTQTVKEKTIFFYGKNFTPLSSDCYGCYHYGTICAGSVFEGGECRAGIVEDTRPALIAFLMMKATDNRFTLARAWGYDIESVVDKKDLEGNQELLDEYEVALNTPEDVIENYKKMYSLDLFAEEEVYQPAPAPEKPTRVDEDPFKDCDTIDITDEELPF